MFKLFMFSCYLIPRTEIFDIFYWYYSSYYAYIGFQRVAWRLDVDVSVAVVGAGVCERWHVAPQVDTVIAVVELTAEAERTVYLKRHAQQSL